MFQKPKMVNGWPEWKKQQCCKGISPVKADLVSTGQQVPGLVDIAVYECRLCGRLHFYHAKYKAGG